MPATTELHIGDLYAAIRPSPPLAPDDSMARAARLFRARGTPVLLVSRGAELVGVVYESDVVRLAAEASDPRAFLRDTPVSHSMRPPEVILSTRHPLVEAARQLAQLDLAAAPVAAADGRYLGMLHRADLLTVLAGEPLPLAVGGLATPFGVRLTTGALSAGAGHLAVASNGAALALFYLIFGKGLDAARTWAHHTWATLNALASPGSPGATLEDLLLGAVPLVVFLLVLRFSPLSAIHGAEHMVVHAIEEGEDLTLEKVRPMPRVHPRCGTNVVALVALVLVGRQLLFGLSHLDEATGGLGLLVVVVIVLMTWRRLGHGLQWLISTKSPSDRQLAQAIQVGEDLLTKMAEQPGARGGFFRRLWSSGFPQVAAGFLVVSGLASGVEWLLSHGLH